MRVVVTGGCGFIGSRLVRHLLASERECLLVDSLAQGGLRPERHSRLTFVEQDVCDQISLVSIFQEFRPSVLVHLAAIHHIPTCERYPTAALNVNIVGFQAILDAATAVGCRKVILASSGAVYGWNESPLSEDRTPIKPTDIYSLSKVTNETQLELWAAKTGAIGVVARIFNTIGENDPNGHLIPEVLRQLDSKADPARIKLGNLSSRRDYIYVEDTAACLSAMVEAEGFLPTEYFNIGTGVEYSVRELVERIAAIMGKSIEVCVDPARVRQVDRPSQLADMTKTLSRFPWKPTYSLDKALTSILGHLAGARSFEHAATPSSSCSPFRLVES
jgi:nucleoside-diphosphate-sugar epimerase